MNYSKFIKWIWFLFFIALTNYPVAELTRIIYYSGINYYPDHKGTFVFELSACWIMYCLALILLWIIIFRPRWLARILKIARKIKNEPRKYIS